jgi:hypothetical protein
MEESTARRDKSIHELACEALWFVLHTVLAVVLLAIVLGLMTLAHPDPDSALPKRLATALVFLIPLVGGFLLARILSERAHAQIARNVWISALLLFSVVCVWVLDLPTGNGLCQSCGAIEKLWRTFFTLNRGSGLLGGDGLLVGIWLPLCMLGYAAGAALGLKD